MWPTGLMRWEEEREEIEETLVVLEHRWRIRKRRLLSSDPADQRCIRNMIELRNREAEAYAEELLRSGQESSEVTIDLRTIKRVGRFGGALIANTLLGPLSEHALMVYFPREAYRLGMLARGGLLFALAHHKHAEIIDAPEDLRRWGQNWVPGTAPTPLYWTRGSHPRHQLALFHPSDLGEGEYPSVFGPYSAAFVNAHLATLGSIRDELSDRVIWPWLTRLIPAIQNESAASQRVKAFVSDVGSLVDELVENVSEHGAFRLSGRRRYPANSLVQVSITRGGADSFDRLYVSVQDTGPGIESTARPKLEPHSRDSLPPIDLVHGLFEGTIDSWPERRGRGLPRVLDIYHRGGHEAKFSVATGAVRLTSSAGQAVKSYGASLEIQGTIVVLMLPLPAEEIGEGFA